VNRGGGGGGGGGGGQREDVLLFVVVSEDGISQGGRVQDLINPRLTACYLTLTGLTLLDIG